MPEITSLSSQPAAGSALVLIRPRPHGLALCLLLGLLPPSLRAHAGAPEQERAEQMERVVVTATRSAKAVEKIPGAVSIISSEEIARQGLISEDPSELLARQVPGYAPARQKLSNFGEGLRGRNALLLLDGIPQTNPLRFGGREGYFADPMIIERIEVISGASAIQGMGATGGIINTITRRSKTPGSRHTLEFKLGHQGDSDSTQWKSGYMFEHLSPSTAERPGWDLLAYVGGRHQAPGVDGQGRVLATESLHRAGDAFLKAGLEVNDQRLQLMLNRYEASGFDDWVDVPGDRRKGLPTSARPGQIDWQAPRNRVQSASLEWNHGALAGGDARVQLFKQDFRASYSGGVIGTFQDARLAPLGRLIDQSQVQADKWGLRASWVRPDLVLEGLELTAGVDYLSDTSSQNLLSTGRLWVPPLKFSSLAPFAQLEYEQGSLTLRGGLRHDASTLRVDDYRTLAFYGSPLVQGGEREASKLVKSLGGVWRFGHSGWSAFLAYNEGFGPPDAGLILRAVKAQGQSVSRLVDLQPVVTDNRELGLTWRGRHAGFSASVYQSRSDFGSQIIIVNGIGTVQRVPIVVKGFEFSGDWQLMPALRLQASHALVRGRTASAPGQPLDLDLGARNQGPDKSLISAQWQLNPRITTQLTAIHLGSRHANAGKTANKTSLEERFSGYTLLEASARWSSPWGELGLGIENLLNKQYIGYYSQSHYAGSDEDYYAGRGRTLTISWRRSFF